MLKVGLTGGIASGKSAVGEMFAALGAHLIQADQIAHELMRPGEVVYDQVVSHFGRGILDDDGTINRARLAELAFSAAGEAKGSRVQELNRIVHPAVIRRQEQWMEEVGRADPHAVAIVEAALIVEAGAARRFGRLIVVTCNDDQRALRFAARHKINLDAARKEVQRRMAAQIPEAEKVKVADYIVDNSRSLDETGEQVRHVWQQLSAEAGKSCKPARQS
jgi:dephospho-CoA kinase